MKSISALAFAAAILVSGGAFAADLQIPATPDKAMAMAVPSTWDGFYAGVNAGYANNNRTGDWAFAGAPGTGANFDYNLAGGLIGAQAGFNYTLSDSFVIGVQVDADVANINGSIPASDPNGNGGSGQINWLASATAKLGYSTGNFLLYVEGGYALADYQFQAYTGCNVNQTNGGFAAGVGASYKFSKNVSADLNYQHVWLQDRTSTCTAFAFIPLDVTTQGSLDVVKAGLNYHFD